MSRKCFLEGKASPDYAAITSDGRAVIVAAEKPFKFTYDSEKPVMDVVKEPVDTGIT